jgi:pyruvate formate lyase activating enzyme
MSPSTTTALLFNLQRFSTEDGPGIRTTLFFKGCPLTCPWCHNPEGMSTEPLIAWYDARCIGCRDCLEACPRGALADNGNGPRRDEAACDLCGTCVEVCPAGAREVIGREYTLEALVVECLKDRTFYATSGGGVTLSGGEPLSQAPFVLGLARLLKAEGLHVALDTSGVGSRRALDELLETVDLVLLDLKLMDKDAHRHYTGVPLEAVLAALDAVSASGTPLWVRTPVIPGCTDGEANIRAIAAHLATKAPTLERYDLLAFENTCRAKYRLFDLDFALTETPLLSVARLEELAELARAEGLSVVKWSGPTTTKEQSSC